MFKYFNLINSILPNLINIILVLTCVDSRIVASRLFRAEPGAYFNVRYKSIFQLNFNFIPVISNC